MAQLADLLDNLPVCSRLPLLVSAHPAIIQPEQNPNFVAPPLKITNGDPLSDQRHPFILISAPGAVGKSTLASHIAANRATALWDLSRLALGDNTFIGTLASAFGPPVLPSILSGLVKGESLFVFDAFDEAELLSGWDRVENFVKELWEYVGKATQTAAILLARTETAQLLDFLLSELGGGQRCHTVLELDYFDEKGARLFLDRQLSQNFKITLHEQHPEPFQDAVSGIFDVLARVLSVDQGRLWIEPIGRTFLGYAPVLQAIAASLAQFTNFQEAVNSFEAAAEVGAQRGLLPTLMTGLTDRERNKFVDPLRERPLPVSEPEPRWDNLYSESEQLRRIFLYLAQDEEAFEVGTLVPSWLAPAYESALRAFFPSHPFLRGRDFAGPAFRDFVFANLLLDDDLGPFVELRLEELSFVPTPLFADFYRLAANSVGFGRHAGFIYDSVLARFGLEHASLSATISPEGEGDTHVLTIVPNEDESGEAAFRMDLRVSADNPLTFRQRLRNAVVNVRGPIVLGSHSQFELSDVEIQARTFDIQAPVLVVRAHSHQNRVLIQAVHSVKHPSQLRIEVRAGGELKVEWPGSNRYPWAGYHSADIFSESLDRQGAMLALRRILIWFRRDRREDLARYRDLIDNVVVGHSKVRRDMRDFLLSKGILRVDGNFYKMDSGVAHQHGINWVALRAVPPHPGLFDLLDEFLGHSLEIQES
jgi:hypothetical protein